MPTCNIDAKGKLARLIYGLVMILIAVALMIWWAWPSGSALRWTISSLCLLAGGFGIYEARAGWCIVRAMGIKTRL